MNKFKATGAHKERDLDPWPWNMGICGRSGVEEEQEEKKLK